MVHLKIQTIIHMVYPGFKGPVASLGIILTTSVKENYLLNCMPRITNLKIGISDFRTPQPDRDSDAETLLVKLLLDT